MKTKMTNGKSVVELLEAIELATGSLAKREILDENVDDKTLRRTMRLTYDPYTTFGVAKVPTGKLTKGASDPQLFVRFLDVLEELAAKKYTGNAARAKLAEVYEAGNALEQKWMKRVVKRNLRCGVQTSTINKVWSDLITPFAVALATSLTARAKGDSFVIVDEIAYPVRVEPKLDGLRLIAVRRSGVVTMYTRNGTEINTLPHVKAALEGIEGYGDFALDGEAMGKDWNESASVLMSSKNKKDFSNVVYNVFDGMSLAEWEAQSCPLPYCDRVAQVTEFMKRLGSSCVRQVPGIDVDDEKELKEWYTKFLDAGFEGLMVKDTDALYRFKRSDNLRKLKPVATYEGSVVDHYLGRENTKREGLFAGFEVLLPNGVITSVGGGFSDALKAEIEKKGPAHYYGCIVECKAQPPLTDDGKMRFPVFCRFRSPNDVDPAVLDAYEEYKASN